jgi:hypothetical protein
MKRFPYTLAACALAALVSVAASWPSSSTELASPAEWPAAPVVATSKGPVMEVYKTASCGCCKLWVDHVQKAGFDVRVTDLDQSALDAKKASLGIASRLQSCHTAVVSGYLIEGHVPADDIQRLLKTRPRVAGIAAPGMPAGSPGMEMGSRRDPYDVVAFTRAGVLSTFAKH